MQNKWDERYSFPEFAYGEQPNNYLKQQLNKLPIGTILFPAEGEGRNAVYAATLGWKAYAFDLSVEGNKKAMQLVEKNHVQIQYEVGDFTTLGYQPGQFDAMALIYAHFPADKKSEFHKILTTYLRPGATVIFEAFSKKHLEYVTKNEKVGGPKDLETLFSIEEIKAVFHNFDFLELVEEEIELSEGQFHNGKGSVIRFMARKK